MEYLRQFQVLVLESDFSKITSLWMEYCLSDEIEPQEIREILQTFKHSKFAQLFGKYVFDIFPLWESLPENDIKHSVISLIFDLQTTNEKKYADFACRYLENRYRGEPLFQQKIKMVGLREKKNFQNAISHFEILVHMKEGNCFLHSGGWGSGKVKEVSFLREQVSLEFEKDIGSKEMTFINAFKTLLPLSSDHFLTKKLKDLQELEFLAKESPVDLIIMLLKDVGNKNALEIKDLLCGSVVPEDGWSKWWQFVRNKMKVNPYIDFPSNNKGVFSIREKKFSHEDNLRRDLEKASSLDVIIDMVYSFLRDFSRLGRQDPIKSYLLSFLTHIAKTPDISQAHEVQVSFLIQEIDFNNFEIENRLQELFMQCQDPSVTLSEIHIVAYKKKFLFNLKRLHLDWIKIFLEIIFSVTPVSLKDYVLQELLKENCHSLLKEKIELLVQCPMLSPDSFVWYFQKIMSSEEYLLSDQEGKNSFLESFFILLHQLESTPGSKSLIKKMITFLSIERFIHVRSIFQEASEDVVKEIVLLASKCQSLTSQIKKIIDSLAENVYPHLFSNVKKKEEKIIWTTEEGYRKVARRMEQLHSEIIENAREIGKAKEHGDLRENSEYKYALERRNRLQGEGRFLADQMSDMRILKKGDIDTNIVGVGTVVHLEDQHKETLQYTLLGPWDADPEKNVLSFQSNIARTLIGLSVGDFCKIRDREWKIKNIVSFL